jgi:hypothetical protein
MATRTYGEYLEPVNTLIDQYYPEERAITTRDLRLIATYAVVSALEIKNADSADAPNTKNAEVGNNV